MFVNKHSDKRIQKKSDVHTYPQKHFQVYYAHLLISF